MNALVGTPDVTSTTPSPDSCQASSLWAVGVVCSLIASGAYTTGFLLQKKAHAVQESLPEPLRSKSCAGLICSTRWIIGLVVVILLSIPFDFVAFTEAGEALASPLKGFAIILNQVMAPFLLGERLIFWDYISTLLVLIGCTITTIFGPHVCQTYNVDQLFLLFKDVPFIVCESVLFVISLFCIICLWRYRLRMDYQWVNYLAEQFECPLTAFLAGAMGVQVNILMKCVGVMIQDDIADHTSATPNYQHYFFWLTAVISLVFVLGQLSIINHGLANFEAVKFMPMMVVIFIVGCSVVGGVYYHEFAGFVMYKWVMFPLGCLITLAGVLLLTLTEDRDKRLYSAEFNVLKIGSEFSAEQSQSSIRLDDPPGCWDRLHCACCRVRRHGLLEGHLQSEEEGRTRGPWVTDYGARVCSDDPHCLLSA